MRHMCQKALMETDSKNVIEDGTKEKCDWSQLMKAKGTSKQIQGIMLIIYDQRRSYLMIDSVILMF